MQQGTSHGFRLFAVVATTLFVLAASKTQTQSDDAAGSSIQGLLMMLMDVNKKAVAEQQALEDSFRDFDTYCRSNAGSLKKSIAEDEARVPELESDMNSLEEAKEQVKSNLDNLDERYAVRAMEQVTAERDTNRNELQVQLGQGFPNTEAVGKAVEGKSIGFLQTSSAVTWRADAVKSSEVENELSTERLHHLESASTLTGEVTSLAQRVQAKRQQAQQMAVSISADEGDLQDALESLAEDRQVLASVGDICLKKKRDFDQRRRMLSAEKAATSDTIAILTNHSAVRNLEESLQGSKSSLLQVTAASAARQQNALGFLRQVQSDSPRMDLISLALRGRRAPLDKVSVMVGDMKRTLEKEQADDETKKAYCLEEFGLSADKTEEILREAMDPDSKVHEVQAELDALTNGIKSREADLAALDMSIFDAQQRRKVDNAEFNQAIAKYVGARKVLHKATARLRKFYGAPLPAMFVQVEEGGTILSAIGLLTNAVEEKIAKAEADEAKAQAAHENTLQAVSAKRDANVKVLDEVSEVRAELQRLIQSDGDTTSQGRDRLAEFNKYIAALQRDCDFILRAFNARRALRQRDIDGLNMARTVIGDFGVTTIGGATL